MSDEGLLMTLAGFCAAGLASGDDQANRQRMALTAIALIVRNGTRDENVRRTIDDIGQVRVVSGRLHSHDTFPADG